MTLIYGEDAISLWHCNLNQSSQNSARQFTALHILEKSEAEVFMKEWKD